MKSLAGRSICESLFWQIVLYRCMFLQYMCQLSWWLCQKSVATGLEALFYILQCYPLKCILLICISHVEMDSLCSNQGTLTLKGLS